MQRSGPGRDGGSGRGAPATLLSAAIQHRPGTVLHGPDASAAVAGLVHGTSLAGGRDALRGRSVLIATESLVAAALAMAELDGVARRIVLCLPGLAPGHAAAIAMAAEADAVVSDGDAPGPFGAIPCRVAGGPRIMPAVVPAIVPAAPWTGSARATEWVILTSGTTGAPKLIVHTLASLAGATAEAAAPASDAVWSTFYDIRRYGGLQVALRALLGGRPLVLPGAGEPVEAFLARAGAHGVTHISGTPSHWRRALMSPEARRIAPRYVRLSGEIADQAILDRLRAFYPGAAVAHAFASTEAGVAFDVNDGRAGFPAALVGRQEGVEMRVEDGSLRIRSPRTALRDLSSPGTPIAGADGFVDTGDMVELHDGRYHFAGRRGGVINVGGLKVHPEEVEAVINRHPGVQLSLVTARRSPVTGAIVVADVVAEAGAEVGEALKGDILAACRRALAAHKVPAVIRIVPALDVAASGKLARRLG